MKKMKPGYVSRYYILFVIVVLTFLIRLLFRSNYLDDWDSVQFALAIKYYSIVIHQPHPPGYPVYIFFGRIVDIFFDNPAISLVFLSALFGSLSVIPTYLLSKKFFDEKIGIVSAILLSLTPAHLLFSEVAMTDIVGLFFIVTTIYLLYLGLESKKYLYIGSFVLGITTGIRLTDMILISILFVVLIYRKNLKESMFSIVLTITGILIWLIPIVIDTGFDTLINVEKAQYDYNKMNSTLHTGGLLSALMSIGHLFIEGWTWIIIVFVFVTLVFVAIKIRGNKQFVFMVIKDKRLIFVALWFISYFIFSVLNHTLSQSRYILPMFPPLSIIFAYSMIKIVDLTNDKSIKMSLLAFFSLLIILMGSQAITDAYSISTTKPAPVQAAEFIKSHYDQNTTMIIVTDSRRHFQYYIPNFSFVDTDKINNYILENKTIISEGTLIMFAPSSNIYKFQREKIYPKHEHVLFYENKDLQKQPITLEKDGWYGYETWDGRPARWIENDAILRQYSGSNRTDTINFSTISFYRNRTLEVYNENNITSKINVTTKFSNISVSISLRKGINMIRFHIPEGCDVPSDIKKLNSTDTRCLSISIQNMTINRE